MPRPKDPPDLRLMWKVGTMYYVQDQKQQQIAERLRLSRSKVSRLLSQAREHGIVRISIVAPGSDFSALEARLEDRYGLQEALVVKAEGPRGQPESEALIKRQLGAAAAEYLHRTVSSSDVIGLTWGTTLQAMVRAMQPLPIGNAHVVQALGGVGPPEAEAHAADLSRRLARLLDCKLTLLPTPGIVHSAEARQVLLADQHTQGALRLFSKIDIAFVGIGALTTNSVLMEESVIGEDQVRRLLDTRAVGDIALRFFDEDGAPIEGTLASRTIGIGLDDLRRVDRVVGVAGGVEKTAVIRAALRGKLVSVLITDQATALRLTDEAAAETETAAVPAQ